MRIRLAILLLLLVSCGKLKELPTSPDVGGGGDPIDTTATFTRVQNEIFTPTCAVIGCHGSLGAQQGLVLAPGRAYTSIVSKPSTEMPQISLVLRSDPANSYLYRKVTGAGITGTRMPQAGQPLSDAQLKLIRDWIRRGAPND